MPVKAETIWDTTSCSGTGTYTIPTSQRGMIAINTYGLQTLATTTLYTAGTPASINWAVYAHDDTSYTTALDSGSVTSVNGGYISIPINVDVSTHTWTVITLQAGGSGITGYYTLCQADSLTNMGGNKVMATFENNVHNYTNAMHYMRGTVTGTWIEPECDPCPDCPECVEVGEYCSLNIPDSYDEVIYCTENYSTTTEIISTSYTVKKYPFAYYLFTLYTILFFYLVFFIVKKLNFIRRK